MKPYFSDDAVWEPAKAIIYSWIGTPYRHLWMAKGRGADCSLFIAAILVEIGVAKEVKYKFYPPDWYMHTKKEAVLETIENSILSTINPGLWLEEIELPLMRGDIPIFSTIPATGVANHSGIMVDDKTFVHSAGARGVSEMSWGNYWARCMKKIYRVVVKQDGI